MPDEDIMDKLMEIDEDEILSEEFNLDDDLDFEGLEDMDNPPEPSPVVAPPSPQLSVPAPESKSKKTAAKKSPVRVKPQKKPLAKSVPETPVHVPPHAGAETSVTEVEELIVRAKVLRIVASKVIIEPGDNISLSSS